MIFRDLIGGMHGSGTGERARCPGTASAEFVAKIFQAVAHYLLVGHF